MASHKLRIDFDEATGTLTIDHRCSTSAEGHTITSSELIKLIDHEEYKASLKRLIDTNRDYMEKLSRDNAVEHIAAIQGIKRKGRKQIKLGGTMGATGNTEG